MKKIKKYPLQQGASLIENLVAVLLVSFASLGLIGLQSKAISVSNDAHDRNLAAILADDVVSMMQMRKSLSLTDAEKNIWQKNLKASGIPGIEGEIAKDEAKGISTITITWESPKTADPYTLSTSFILPKEPV